MAILEWVPIKTIIPSTIFAHVAVVLELNWFYNQELRSKQTLSIPNYLGRSGDFTKTW
jgi:hypothetical protein